MVGEKYTILVADDDRICRNVLSSHLKSENYRLILAQTGTEAWQLLEQSPEIFSTAILDWEMPGYNGLEILEKMKSHGVLKHLPVIMQTAKSDEKDILKGLQAGASFYLTKPCLKKKLLAVLKTTIETHTVHLKMQTEIFNTTETLGMMSSGTFEFRTLEEGQNIAEILSKLYPRSGKLHIGLWELLVNAVEHGNLGITYEEKTRLNEDNIWIDEIKRRMTMGENLTKKVVIDFKNTNDEIRFHIKDQGEGFEWEKYLELCPDRAFDSHGRGIATARIYCFDRVEYLGKGNEVVAIFFKNRNSDQ